MNNLYKLFALISITAFFSACSGDAPENKASTNTNSTAPAQANSYAASNGETMQPAFNAETKNSVNANQISTNMTVANAGNQAIKQDQPVTSELPAADNSTYSAEMNDKGQPVETRTFKSHPILAKIEKITLSPRDYVYKIYLKDGKVVESKSEELKQFRFIAPENILEAIGKLPKATPDPNDPTRDGKKKQQMMIPSANQ